GRRPRTGRRPPFRSKPAPPSPRSVSPPQPAHGPVRAVGPFRQATASTMMIDVDFEIPPEIGRLLARIDAFIEAEIKPLEERDDNIRFFDHRREFARTDFDNGGVPRAEWYALLGEMRRRADAAGLLRCALPAALGGSDGSNLGMAIIREHLAAKGLGLHNDLQNESSIVGNFPSVLMVHNAGTPEQQAWCEKMLTGEMRVAFGL